MLYIFSSSFSGNNIAAANEIITVKIIIFTPDEIPAKTESVLNM